MVSRKGMTFYFITLVLVSVLFVSHILPLVWVLFGAVEVCSFFYFSNLLTKRWRLLHPDVFVRKLFWTSLGIRTLYMFFVYFFYDVMTGQPFMFHAADELWYYEMSNIWSEQGLAVFRQAMAATSFSDSGEIYWDAFLCKIMGSNIIGVRFIHCLASATTCVLIYQLAKRHFGDGVGRMSAIFCMLMPNLIYYCGIHLKEADMVFLTILFVDSVDWLVINGKFNTKYFILALFSFLALFTYRTVLGIVGLIATTIALALNKGPLKNWWKRVFMILVVAVTMSVTVIGDRIMGEVEGVWEGWEMNQRVGMEWRAEQEGGNIFARYASRSVFAPLIFTLPFPTMVNSPNQENQQMLHGGNYVKNIISGFTLFALLMLILRGEWRKHTMPIAMMLGYLLVIAFSNFAHSERFHQPVIPLELMFAAVGVSLLNKNNVKWVDYWMFGILLANVAWAWIKLAGKGIL